MSLYEKWSAIRYSLYSPLYNVLAHLLTAEHRRASIGQLKGQGISNTNTLIVGAGSGHDLKFLPLDYPVTAIDISRVQVEKMRKRAKKLNRQIDARIMDAHHLTFQNEEFDLVILHLILSVVPNPERCMKEAERVLKPGGMMLVFDNFLPEKEKASPFRLLANTGLKLIFSDFNIQFNSLINESELSIIKREPMRFLYSDKIFQRIQLQKKWKK